MTSPTQTSATSAAAAGPAGVSSTHSGQQEVAGTSDVGLLEAIPRGDVPRPPLCAFSHGENMWVSWRRDIGRRPTMRRDGISTTGTLEVHLHRTIMFELYGETWKEDFQIRILP